MLSLVFALVYDFHWLGRIAKLDACLEALFDDIYILQKVQKINGTK